MMEKKKINENNLPVGVSVTQRIRQIKQPRGGYLNPKEFQTIELERELIHPSLIGLAVDYMTRFMLGKPIEEAFRISIMGSYIIGEYEKACKLISEIKGLDEHSVSNAIKLAGFDVCYRAGIFGFFAYVPVDEIYPDDVSIKNVQIMIRRSLAFFEKYGPVVMDGFTFEGGYTDIISSGDGDFLTKDTLWDFKVSKNQPTKDQTLQLFIYWRMGLHSIHPEFKKIKYLGIYNPRLNIVYRFPVSNISTSVIKDIEKNVIGY